MTRSRLGFAASLCLWITGLLLAGTAPTEAQQRLAPADALQLAQAAGFRYVNNELLNVCGKPAAPRFAFLDLNGDGRPEAVVIDNNAGCYGPPGDWFSILVRGSNGQWRALLREVGTVQWERTRSRGWLDAWIKTVCDGIWHFNGVTYVPAKDCTPRRAAASAAPPASAPAATSPPAAAGALSGAEQSAVMRTAGFVQRGGAWRGCEGETTASIEAGDIRDLNGDGRPEVIVTDSGTACYGMTGQGFVLLTRAQSGQWRKLFASPGIPEFLATSANGWPELEVGGPGFCAQVLRWNGRTYAFHRNHETMRGACARR
jgi:hypothetical protein